MKQQIADGVALTFDDSGTGKPLVLLHAFPLAGAMWTPQVEALRDEYRVIVPDLRGFGGSDGFPGSGSIARLADDVAALLDALGVREPVALGGLSMGGYVALAFARHYPERLRALILADTRSEPDSAEARASRDQTIAVARAQGVAGVIEGLLPKLVSDATRLHRPQVVDEVRALASRQSTAGVVAALEALRDRPDAGPWLSSIKVPTLVLVGSADVLTPPDLARSLAQGIRGARLMTLDGAGHLSNLEAPAEFSAAVRLFLRGLM